MRELQPHEASRVVTLGDIRSCLLDLATAGDHPVSYPTVDRCLEAVLNVPEAEDVINPAASVKIIKQMQEYIQRDDNRYGGLLRRNFSSLVMLIETLATLPPLNAIGSEEKPSCLGKSTCGGCDESCPAN